MRGKKVVVTGGLGFIGSHLVEALVEDNDVTVIDNRSTGTLENLRNFADARLEVIEGDVATLNLVDIFDGCDCVFHLAALPSVERSINDPLASNESNTTGTLNVLVAAKESGVGKVVFASSSSVYGDAAALPKREDMCLAPLSLHAVTKAAGELLHGFSTSLRFAYHFPALLQRVRTAAKPVFSVRSGHPKVYYRSAPQFTPDRLWRR